jgi:hypothetical protein
LLLFGLVGVAFGRRVGEEERRRGGFGSDLVPTILA